MALLPPFSKPRWQHPQAEVRLAAIEELDDLEILLQIVQADDDAAVRSRSLERIGDPAVLDRLIDDPPAGLGDELRQQARLQRLRQLLDDGGLPPGDADDPLLMRIARLTDDDPIIENILARLDEPQSRLDLALGHPIARVRLAAAQSIQDMDLLQSLLQQAKHRDKAVFRHCRERIDEQLAAQRSDEELRQKLARLGADAAELRVGVDSPDYRARYLRLLQRWAEIGGQAGPDETARIQGDLDACARRVEERAAAAAAEERKRAQVEEAGQSFVGLLQELDALDPAALASVESAAELEARLNGIEERWVAALRDAHPEPQQTEACKARLGQWRASLLTLRHLESRRAELDRFEKAASGVDLADFKALQKLQQQAVRLARALPWPEEFEPSVPEAIRALRAQRARLDARIETLQAKEQKALAKVDTAFETFRAELAARNSRNAERALNRLRNLLRQVSPARQDKYHNELRPLLAKLQEIHDWQGFAIEPKKQELVGQMEALVGSDADADTLAARIKALQDEWKALGPLAPRRDQELWKAFRAAADAAWAPCKDAFEQRAEARKQVYRQRMALVEQLKDYEGKIAWPDRAGDRGDSDPELPAPDWKMVRKTLDTARKAFAELTPVDHKQDRKSRKALDKVCNRIYAHLEQEYARNIERKKALVDEAKALVGVEDLGQAVDRAKAIQREWKDLGPTPQKVDRPLWKEFRAACDAIFARLGEERDRRQAEQHARTEQRRVVEKARAEKAAERKRQAHEQWQRLFDRMRACATRAADPDQAALLWGEDGDLPKGVDAKALEAWWTEPPRTPEEEEACRTACIALEVLAGKDSPPEDRQARMAYQMQRLVEGMGSARVDAGEFQLEQINGFIALRPTLPWLERFRAAIDIP